MATRTGILAIVLHKDMRKEAKVLLDEYNDHFGKYARFKARVDDASGKIDDDDVEAIRSTAEEVEARTSNLNSATLAKIDRLVLSLSGMW